MGWCNIGPDEGAKAVADLLMFNSTLVVLDLRGNGLGNAGAPAPPEEPACHPHSAGCPEAQPRQRPQQARLTLMLAGHPQKPSPDIGHRTRLAGLPPASTCCAGDGRDGALLHPRAPLVEHCLVASHAVQAKRTVSGRVRRRGAAGARAEGAHQRQAHRAGPGLQRESRTRAPAPSPRSGAYT